MPLDLTATEMLYDQMAEAIDQARKLGDPQEMESLFLAKLAFAALRELNDPTQAELLITQAMNDLDRQD